MQQFSFGGNFSRNEVEPWNSEFLNGYLFPLTHWGLVPNIIFLMLQISVHTDLVIS